MAIAETQLTYNGNRLIPAPLVEINQDQSVTVDGERVGQVFTITANGTLVAYKGSPTSSGTWWTGDGYPLDESLTEEQRLAAILHKQDAMRKLLADQFKLLKIQPADASSPLYCNPKIRSVQFPEGPWFDTCTYTVVFEAEKLWAAATGQQDNSAVFLEGIPTESWSLSPGEVTGSFNLEHTLNAQGRGVPNTGGFLTQPGWLTAKIWCSGRMGFDGGIVGSSFLLTSGLSPWNPTRNEDINETEGSYSITESWILAPTSALETYTTAWNIINDDNFATANVTVRGNIRGLYSTLNGQAEMIPNASSFFSSNSIPNAFSRATVAFPENAVFNTNPATKTADYDWQNGTISYEMSFNDGLYVSGTQEEYSIDVNRGQDTYTAVTIQGTIFGRLLDTEHNINNRFTRALARWAVVEPQLFSRVSGYASGLQPFPLSKSINRNPIQGSVQYNAEFNDRDNNGYLETHTASLRWDTASGRKTVAINGQIQGVVTAEMGGWNNRWGNAQSGWVSVSSLIYPWASSLLGTIKSKPMSQTYEENPREGVINYSREYNDRPQNTFEHDGFNVQFNQSRQDGRVSCTVQGTIIGIMDETEDADDKYALAMSGFKSVTGSIYGAASGFVGQLFPSATGLTTLPVVVAIGGNPVAGTINYNYEYDNVPLPTISGALSQVINIQDGWAKNIFNVFVVPLSSGDGPIVQDVDALSEKRRSGTVEIVMPLGAPKPDRASVDLLIPSPTTGVKFIEENTEVWSSSTGRYTRTLSWVYSTTGIY